MPEKSSIGVVNQRLAEIRRHVSVMAPEYQHPEAITDQLLILAHRGGVNEQAVADVFISCNLSPNQSQLQSLVKTLRKQEGKTCPEDLVLATVEASIINALERQEAAGNQGNQDEDSNNKNIKELEALEKFYQQALGAHGNKKLPLSMEQLVANAPVTSNEKERLRDQLQPLSPEEEKSLTTSVQQRLGEIKLEKGVKEVRESLANVRNVEQQQRDTAIKQKDEENKNRSR